LAEKKQIICITHLPHIASQADLNLKVGKEQRNGEVISTVTQLNGKDRENEIARMLGAEDSAASKKYARELIKAKRK
jgi:DNA repair protein RecN (Recombination protein N)